MLCLPVELQSVVLSWLGLGKMATAGLACRELAAAAGLEPCWRARWAQLFRTRPPLGSARAGALAELAALAQRATVREWRSEQLGPTLGEGGVNCAGAHPLGVLTGGFHDGQVRLWLAAAPGEHVALGMHGDVVSGVGWCDERTGVSSGWDGWLRMWDFERCCQAAGWHVQDKRLLGMDVAGSGRVVTAGLDGRVRLWDLRGPASCGVALQKGDEKCCYSVQIGAWQYGDCCAANEEQIAVGCQRFGQILDVRSPGNPLYRCNHQSAVLCVHRRGSRIVTGGKDGVVRVWDLGHRSGPAVMPPATAQCVQVLTHHKSGVR